MTAARARERWQDRLLAIPLASMLFFNTGVAADFSRFSLAGQGTLSIEEPAKVSGPFELRASLSPSAALPSAQSAGRFALLAALSTTSLVCYNDTIFRDDFDGDGF